jgi:hypothetical protein
VADQSLVVVEAQSDGGRRYRLLETARAYAAERLAAAGEVDKLRDRHATHFGTLAQTARPDLLALRFDGWLDRLEREHDNFRAALDWLASRDRVDECLQLATGLALFWYARGYAIEGRERLESLIGLRGQVRDRIHQAALDGLNTLVMVLNDGAEMPFLESKEYLEVQLWYKTQCRSNRSTPPHDGLACGEGRGAVYSQLKKAAPRRRRRR